uniref:Modulator of smoothened n=1 Tax=Saimiri boliviensis boliviensis TaxID=39432 RepID=A0A2K6TAG2_SAIBB
MDKLTIISGCLFLAADIFTITSITNPDWLNTGESVGALTCQTIHGRDGMCISPGLPLEWVTTRFFIIMGIISLTVTCGLLVASHWGREATKCTQWIAFTGTILFCMAALIFPIGFYINEVRGDKPYWKDPNNVAGSSYVLFVSSIFFTIVGLLFAAKFVYQADKCLNSLTLLLLFIFGGWGGQRRDT